MWDVIITQQYFVCYKREHSQMKPGQSCVICPQADALLLWWHKWAMVVVRDAIMTLEAGRTVFRTIVQYFAVVYIFWARVCTISQN